MKRSYSEESGKEFHFFEHFGLASASKVFVLELFTKKDYRINYIEISLCARLLSYFVRWMHILELEPARFKMLEVREGDGQMVRHSIFQNELGGIVDRASSWIRDISREQTGDDLYIEYLVKGAIDGQINECKSLSRLIYIAKVGLILAEKGEKPVIYFEDRLLPVVLYSHVLGGYERFVVVNSKRRCLQEGVACMRYLSPRLYTVVRALSEGIVTRRNVTGYGKKVYMEYRGSIDYRCMKGAFKLERFEALGVKNIVLPLKKIMNIGDAVSKGISPVRVSIGELFGSVFEKRGRDSKFSGGSLRARLWIFSKMREYRSLKSYWRLVFRVNNIGVFFHWYAFSRHHLAAVQSIRELRGVSVLYPVSTHLFSTIDQSTCQDVSLEWSSLTGSISRRGGVNARHQLSVGFGMNITHSERERSKQVTRSLKDSGARFIMCMLDENSVADERWHSGHGLQRLHYRSILQYTLSRSDIGLVIKPKRASNLRSRLGREISALIDKLVATGRCYIYMDARLDITDMSVQGAVLDADLCIHTCLAAGTAGIEAHLQGVRTIFINLEGMRSSILNVLPQGKVVFDNWSDALLEIDSHLRAMDSLGESTLGVWDRLLDMMDEFRDNGHDVRVTSFLRRLLIKQSVDSNFCDYLGECVKEYKSEWGDSAVIKQRY